MIAGRHVRDPRRVPHPRDWPHEIPETRAEVDSEYGLLADGAEMERRLVAIGRRIDQTEHRAHHVADEMAPRRLRVSSGR